MANWIGKLLERKPFRLVSVALANKRNLNPKRQG